MKVQQLKSGDPSSWANHDLEDRMGGGRARAGRMTQAGSGQCSSPRACIVSCTHVEHSVISLGGSALAIREEKNSSDSKLEKARNQPRRGEIGADECKKMKQN